MRLAVTRRGSIAAATVTGPLDDVALAWAREMNLQIESVSLQEYGYDEQFGSVQIVMGAAGKNRTGRITTFTIDDFLFYIERSRYWKLTEVKPNYALGLFTSFDLTARWVQKYEVYQKFPT